MKDDHNILMQNLNGKEYLNDYELFYFGYAQIYGIGIERNIKEGFSKFENLTKKEFLLKNVAKLIMIYYYQYGITNIIEANSSQSNPLISSLYTLFEDNPIHLAELLNTLRDFLLNDHYQKGLFYCLLGLFWEGELLPDYWKQESKNYLNISSENFQKAAEISDELFSISAHSAMKRIESIKKSKQLKQLMEQQSFEKRQQYSYQQHDQDLSKLIEEISTDDDLDRLILLLNPSINNEKYEDRNRLKKIIFWVEQIRNIKQRRWNSFTNFYQSVISIKSQYKISVFDKQLISNDITTKEGQNNQLIFFWKYILPDQLNLLIKITKRVENKSRKNQLFTLQSYIENLLNQKQQQKEINFIPTLIHNSSNGTRILLPQFGYRLLPKNFSEENYLKSDVKQGSHPVIIINGVHYKCVTDGLVTISPGVEYMVDRLNKLLIGHGSAPTTLLKVSRGKKQIIFQASKTVQGIDLEYILQSHPEYLDHLDMNNYSAMTILGILTNPQDGKPDNYMVEIEVEKDLSSNDQIKALHIVGIDNDLAFGQSVKRKLISNGKEELFLTEVKNVLFLFPQMNLPFHSQIRSHLSTLAIEFILLQWLYALHQQNQSYDNFLHQNIFTVEEMNLLRIPIYLPQNLTRTIYRKLKKIQSFIRSISPDKDITHQSLLSHVEPIIGEFYERARSLYPDIREGIHYIYDVTLGDELKSRYNNQIDDFHTVASRLIYESKVPLNNDITIIQAVEELILEIDWKELSEDIQEEILFGKLSPLNSIQLTSPTELLHQLIPPNNISNLLIQFLMKQGAILSSVEELRGYNVLHIAVRYSSIETLEEFIRLGANVNEVDHSGEFPLDKLLKSNLSAENIRNSVLFLINENHAKVSDVYVDVLSEYMKEWGL